MKLRSSLLRQTLAVLIPAALFGIGTAGWLVVREQRTNEVAVRDRTLTLRVAVDGEVRASIEAAKVLAASDALARGDLRAFHREMVAAVAAHPDWGVVNLVEPDGRQTLSAARPFGVPLPPVADPESVARAVRERQPAIGDLVRGPISGDLRVAVRVPVLRDGVVERVVTVAVRPQAWDAMLQAQDLPPGWVAAILDGRGRFVARSEDAALWTGTAAHEPFLGLATGSAADGWLAARNRAGDPVYAAYRRSPLTGWLVVLALPSDAYLGAAWRTAAALALGAAVALALAIRLSGRVADRLTATIDGLAEEARRVAHGRAPALPPADGAAGTIDEVRALTESLRAAWSAVSEREHERRLAERERTRLDRSKDEFLAMLGHELRNPLGALTSAAYIVRRRVAGDAATSQALAIIDRQIHQIAGIVDDLLDLNQITIGKARYAIEPVELSGVVSAVLEALDAQGRLAGHRTSVSGGPAWAMVDGSRMQQIVANLLDNALKYTPAGGTIRVRVRVEDDRAVLEVEDDGAGIEPALLPEVFDLFVQGERDLARSQGGFGIGLAVVKRLVDAHGGRIDAASAGAGRGATFTVRLPLGTPAARPARVYARRSDGGRGYRVIVIEDNDDVRDTLVAWLRGLGHDVLSAPDGIEGASLAIRECPELALIDIGLPGLDGYGVARAIRNSDCGGHIRLVALTGYGDLSAAMSTEAGFDVHLTKPLTHANLPELFGRGDP